MIYKHILTLLSFCLLLTAIPLYSQTTLKYDVFKEDGEYIIHYIFEAPKNFNSPIISIEVIDKKDNSSVFGAVYDFTEHKIEDEGAIHQQGKYIIIIKDKNKNVIQSKLFTVQ